MKRNDKILFSFIVVMTLALTAAFAFAQQPQPDFNLKLTGAEVEILGEGLGKLSYEKVAPLINKIRQQIVDQQAKPAPVVNPPAEPKKD